MKKTIYMFTPLYPHRVHRSRGVFVRRHCEVLKDLGYSVVVINPIAYSVRWLNRYKYATCVTEYEDNGIRVFQLYYPSLLSERLPILEIISHAWAANRILRHIDIRPRKDDIIFSSMFFPSGVFAKRYARKRNLAYYHIEHHSLLLRLNKSGYLGRALQDVVRSAKVFAVISEALQDALVGISGKRARNVTILPNVIPFHHKDYPTPKKRAHSYKFIYVGNLVANKNVTMMLDTFIETFKMRNDVKMLIVGDGPEREKMELVVEFTQPLCSIEFVGEVPPGDVYQLYQRTDCLINISLYETFGVVYREAIMSGLPVIVSSLPAYYRDWDDSHGIRVAATDRLAYRDALIKMARKRTRVPLSARSIIAESYSYDSVKIKMKKILSVAV